MPQLTLANILKNQFYGIESVEVYKAVVNDAEIFELLADIVQLTYAAFLGVEGHRFVLNHLQRIRNLEPDCNTDEIKSVMLESREAFYSSRLNDYYHQVFRKNNLLTSIDCVGSDWFSDTVVDIGAYDNMLGHLLLRQCGHVSHVIGVDIAAASDVMVGGSLEFRLQKNPGQVPVSDSTADTIVLRYVLHHTSMDEQISILNEAARILKTNGTVLIYENTYSFHQIPLANRCALHQRIIELGSQERIKLLLAALDTFSQGIKEKHGPFPFTYRSCEQWLKVFSNAGLDILDHIYYGMPIFDLHQAPLGIFVLSNG